MTASIQKLLVRKGTELIQRPRGKVFFTGDSDADAFLNDLRRTPYAFVLGCVVDRQMPAERAWMIPLLLANAIGSRKFGDFEALAVRDLQRLMRRPRPLHRFPNVMAKTLHAAIKLISNNYGGDASRIWAGKPSSAEVVSRFLDFPGVGQKIATMATNILAREFKIAFADYFSVDVSTDVHIRRVFRRLGLVPDRASPEQIVFRARAISPEFPGLLDLPCFMIGRTWCKPAAPHCGECYMSHVCPTAGLTSPCSRPA
jgi:uncharacterized HhH-GPD family protein